MLFCGDCHSSEEWEAPEPVERVSSSGYSRPMELRKPVARIYKCVMDEALARSINKLSVIDHKLWFDTMASHNITNDRRLFGSNGPTQQCNVTVQSWADDEFNVRECGMTIFGMMLYSEKAAGTILAGYEMQHHFDLTWTKNQIKVRTACKMDPSVVIQFDLSRTDRILEGHVSNEMFGHMCCDIFHEQSIDEDISAVKILRVTLDQGSFKRSLESLYFHRVTCHTCMSYIATTAETKIMSNMPFGSHDVTNIALISDGMCPCCALAKSTSSSMNPNKIHTTDSSPRCDLPDADHTSAGDPTSRLETVGFDFMYIDGRPTLVAVGKNLGYVHVVSTASRKTAAVKQAMDLVIKDYQRYGIDIEELVNAKIKTQVVDSQPKRSHPFSGLQKDGGFTGQRPITIVEAAEMDNEASFVDAGLSLMAAKHKVVYAFVVAGEHVSYVERAIRTLKERVAAMRCSIIHRVEDKMLNWLISHAAMWMNVLFSKRAPQSAWWNLTHTQLNYRDITRTKFGDPVIANRPGVLQHGQPRGELGLSMGANPRQPGAIFFYSFETGRVKSRLRFRTHIDVESTKRFGMNKTYVEPARIAQSYMKYVKDRNLRLDEMLKLEEQQATTEGSVDNAGGGMIDDASACFINEHGVELSPHPTIVENDPQKNQVEPEAIAMAVRIAKATLMACRNGITNTNISWVKALVRHGDLGDRALAAINKELRQIIIEYEVCEPVTGHVENCHMSHALYDKEKDKARLVVGKKIRDLIIDYGVELNSPTINGKLVNLMLSTCIEQELELEVWDVKGAFLKAPLHTAGVYVRIEKHIVGMMLGLLKEENVEKFNLWSAAVRSDGTLVVEVQKGWYGLACSSMIWYNEISGTITNVAGYTQHPMEKCLYYKIDQDGSYSYIMLHVDDLCVLVKPGSPECARLKGILESKYEKLKVQTGDRVKYIGFEIFRNRPENRFELTMTQYIEKMCALHDLIDGGHVVKNPATSDDFASTSYNSEVEDKPLGNVSLYRSLVMSMQYGTLVVPSVKYHVISLATRQACPKVGDYRKARRVLDYMRCKSRKPVYIYGFGKDPDIYVYTDAAFDVYTNSVSHTGMSAFIGQAGGAMYCSSNKQKCVTDSSTAAEIVAAVGAMCIGQYYRGILAVFGIKCAVIHYQDNMSCIALVKSGCVAHDKKDRHIVRKINLMHEYFEDKENLAEMVWCDTAWMIADGLTKDLHGQGFDISENVLMGHPIGDIGEYGVRKTKSVGV